MEQNPVSTTAHTAASLRNQLNQIAVASQMLESRTSDSRSHSYLAVINQGVCRMLRIVGRMDLEQRLSEETPRLSPSCFDLSVWLEGLGYRLESILSAAGVRFSFNCPPTLPVCADEDLLRQLLLEAITHLALSAADISLTATVQGQNLHFTLSDSGPGKAEGRPAMPGVLESREEASSLDYARRLAEVLGGALVIAPSEGLRLSLAISVPIGSIPGSHQLKESHAFWNNGGFDPTLVALSELLPADAFLPKNLG